jgi:Arc/MetJ-type ribon-helix-helix transcriptional regulator
MSIQIAVRLPDDLVRSLDELVAQGEANSRASIVERALRRELRNRAYAREAALRASNPELFEDPELDAVAEWASRQAFDLD